MVLTKKVVFIRSLFAFTLYYYYTSYYIITTQRSNVCDVTVHHVCNIVPSACILHTDKFIHNTFFMKCIRLSYKIPNNNNIFMIVIN